MHPGKCENFHPQARHAWCGAGPCVPFVRNELEEVVFNENNRD